MPGHAFLNAERACTRPLISLPSSSIMAGTDTEEGDHRLGGLDVDGTGQRQDHVSARFRLPPGIGDRASAAADLVVDTTTRLRG